MKKIILVSLLLISGLAESQETPEKIIEKFFTTFQKDSDKAIDDIYKTNPWTANMQDAINGMKKTVKNYPEEMGKYYGYELITKQQCTERYLLFSYMARFDRQPMKLVFQFYKPNDKWIIYSLNFDTDIDEDVELAAKYFTQNPKQN